MTETGTKVSGWWRAIPRVFAGILLLIFSCFLIRDSASAGFSRFFSMLAIIESSVSPADEAVRLAPNDPEAHYTRGLGLVNAGRLDEALTELREAIRLRPSHYYEWLDLGVTLDRSGDQAEAESSLKTSINLAPSFAQPHWQLGNLLFRDERYPQAFDELRKGARSNSNLTAGLLQLAWVAAKGEVGNFLSFAHPETKRNYIDVANFLASQGNGRAAVEQARKAGDPGTEEERNLLKQTVVRLLLARDFAAAFDLWQLTHAGDGADRASGRIINGDFINPVLRDDPGFGWQLPEVANVSFSIDPNGPTPDTRSLRLEFVGDNAPLTPLLNQIVLVQPGKRYSLNFKARTEDLVTGGPPVVAVFSLNSQPPKILNMSTPLTSAGSWNGYHFEFWAETTSAVLFTVERQQCSQTPCPAFGKLWLGKFNLQSVD